MERGAAVATRAPPLAALRETADRVAGLLVLLYAQWPATISRLTLDHVHTEQDKVLLRLGREPIVLPEPSPR